MPFYYASLQCLWVFWQTEYRLAQKYVQGTGLQVANFDGKAVAVLNFQRYTAELNQLLASVNEVEFNLVVYPANREPNVPMLSLKDWLAGEDQTKTIGHFRLHVAADNQPAVDAGRGAFGEPKFLSTFTYTVPSLNGSPADKWDTQLNDPNQPPDPKNPHDPNKYIYRLVGDFTNNSFRPVDPSPIPEFATGLGPTVMTYWDILGDFHHCDLADPAPVNLSIGNSKHPMVADLRKLIGANEAVAVQTFTSRPVCIEPRGSYLEARK
jgi:hypothetical protein